MFAPCGLTHFADLPAAVQMHDRCCVSIIMLQNSSCIDSLMLLLGTSMSCVTICHQNCVCETVRCQPCVCGDLSPALCIWSVSNTRGFQFMTQNKKRYHACQVLQWVISHNSSQHLFMVECSCRQGCSKSKSGPGVTAFLPFFRLPSLWAAPSSPCW